MQKKSSPDARPRIPPQVGGIQVNFCTKPTCSNYGVPTSLSPAKGKGAKRDDYSVVSAGKGFPVLKCHACGEHPPLKSNNGISEELERISDYLKPIPEPSCPSAECENHCVGISAGKSAYQTFGENRCWCKALPL